MSCWRSFPTLCCFLVWEMMSRCLAVLVNNMSRQWLQCCGNRAFKQKHQTCKGCVCDWYLMLCTVDAQAHAYNEVSPLFKKKKLAGHFPLLITLMLKGSYGYNQSLAWKCLFLRFPDPLTQTHDMSFLRSQRHQLSQQK